MQRTAGEEHAPATHARRCAGTGQHASAVITVLLPACPFILHVLPSHTFGGLWGGDIKISAMRTKSRSGWFSDSSVAQVSMPRHGSHTCPKAAQVVCGACTTTNCIAQSYTKITVIINTPPNSMSNAHQDTVCQLRT